MNQQGSCRGEDRPAIHPEYRAGRGGGWPGPGSAGRIDDPGIGGLMRKRYFCRAKMSRPAVHPENPAGRRLGVALFGDFPNMRYGIPLIDETGQIHDIQIQ
jgi:hypothetical protein